MQVITVLSLGSNVGDRLNYLNLSKTAICNLIGPIQFSSNIYETEPWGVDNQDSYLNQVISVQTNLSPYELLENIHQIEKDLGRIREIHYGPRTIDIDILYFVLFPSSIRLGLVYFSLLCLLLYMLTEIFCFLISD